ncbi:MBL fold metallo-hydrolase [Pseudarthrobacter sp. J1763]|uniref:MBL fold metallo-hydrolase n=1 Tax=Pseudarthrobacter sp. J1763 TaxID=3420445 RepID=UPI003D2D7BE1
MLLTKFTHSCIRLEKSSADSAEPAVLVLDPGSFSEADQALAGAQTVLITHEHQDHFDSKALATALAAEGSALQVWAPVGVAETLRSENPAAAERIHNAEPRQSFSAGGFEIRTFGGQHALIHASIPMVANVAYLVDDAVYHPGDSFTIPDGHNVEALLVPVHAPWSKSSEVIDFVLSVRAKQAFQMHDALLNQLGLGLVESHVGRLAATVGTTFRHLATLESVEI